MSRTSAAPTATVFTKLPAEKSGLELGKINLNRFLILLAKRRSLCGLGTAATSFRRCSRGVQIAAIIDGEIGTLLAHPHCCTS